MKKLNFILTFILFSFVLTSVFSFIPAQTSPAIALMIELGLADLTKEADSVLIGEVTQIKSEWNEDKTKIYTYITLTVKEQIKGQYKAETVTVKQLGGKVGEIRLTVSNSAIFEKGENAVVFLKPDRVQQAGRGVINKIVGSEQGKYTVLKDEVTGKKMLTVHKGIFAVRAGAIVTRAGEKILLEDFIGQIKRIEENQK